MGAALLVLTQGANIIATTAPIAIELALQIKKLFSQVPGQSFEVQIAVLRDGVIKTVDETDEVIAAWKAAHPEA